MYLFTKISSKHCIQTLNAFVLKDVRSHHMHDLNLEVLRMTTEQITVEPWFHNESGGMQNTKGESSVIVQTIFLAYSHSLS